MKITALDSEKGMKTDNRKNTSVELDAHKFRSQMKSANPAARYTFAAVFGEGRPADRVLAGWLRENRHCGSRDRRFIGEAIYAMFRFWGILRKFLPAERLAEIERGEIHLGRVELDALMFAAFYLDRRNLAAADLLAKELNFPWPRSSRDAADQLAARAGALAELFGVKATFSGRDLLPSWVWDHLPDQLDLEQFRDTLERRPPMWLRLQTADPDRVLAELTAAGLELQRHPRLQEAVAVIAPHINLFTLDAYRNGEFEVQDIASQCIARAAAPAAGERWLDACAGAGGKSLALAQLMQRTGTVVASDVRAYKLDDLRTRARRAGFPNIVTREWDGKPLKGKQRERYDGVLVDAPCSCSGVWRRNPDGRWTLKPEELPEIVRIQNQVLAAAATGVKQGGVLLYATCSLFEEENDLVVKKFLDEHPDFSLEPFPDPLTGTLTDGRLPVFSYDADCDSMFMARMRRTGAKPAFPDSNGEE